MEVETGEALDSYYLSEEFMGGQKFPIDADRYAALNAALTTVDSAREIEELFQIFAHSFLRFEKDLLNVIFEYAYTGVGRSGDQEKFCSDVRNRFNVNIITLLTSFQSYVDQSDRILKYTSNLPTARKFNKKAGSDAFKTYFSYRVCAQLRNYAQHQALPLGGFSIGWNNDFVRDDAGIIMRKHSSCYGVSPWLDVAKFKSSSQVKARLKVELESLGYERIDMKWLVRSFAGAMYRRHERLREFLKPEIEAASKNIAAGYAFASAAKDSEAILLELQQGTEKRHMRNDLAAQVLREFETYTSLNKADQTYVTSQIKPEAESYSGPIAGQSIE